MPCSWLVSAGGTRGHLSLLLWRVAQPRLSFQWVRQDCRREGFSSLKQQRALWHVSAWVVTPHGGKTVCCRQMCWGSLCGGMHIWMVGCTLFTPFLSLPGQLCSIRKQN